LQKTLVKVVHLPITNIKIYVPPQNIVAFV